MRSSEIPKRIKAWQEAHPHVVDEVVMDDNDPNEHGEWSLWLYLKKPYKGYDDRVSIHVHTVAQFFESLQFIEPKIKDCKLTDIQIDFITHRLAVSDAIAESFTDCPVDEEATYSKERYGEIKDAADELLLSIEKHKLLTIDSYSDLQKDIIIDCFEGNTWFAGLESECADEDNPQKFTANERSIDLLTEKLKSYGFNIGFVPKS